MLPVRATAHTAVCFDRHACIFQAFDEFNPGNILLGIDTPAIVLAYRAQQLFFFVVAQRISADAGFVGKGANGVSHFGDEAIKSA